MAELLRHITYTRGGFVKEDMFEILQLTNQRKELAILSSMNQKTERFGLSLREEEMHELIECRNQSLKVHGRVEFGEGILDKIIYTFCDSQYINQQNYLQSLEKLEDIFYEFKNAALELMTDDEILTFMKEQFETVCAGDLDYLEGTCMENFTAAVRAGYEGYKKTGGRGQYEQFDEVPRWDKDLYMQVLKELFWE
ncbi:DUF6323 family protein [Muricomes intestini]|jgi:hypothetical protein